MTTLEQVSYVQNKIFQKATSLVKVKGHDYNRESQLKGDTLKNLRVARMLDIVDSDTQSILVRLGDKFMRLISLTKDPKVTGAVKDESIFDTVVDMFNYTSYLYIMYCEANGIPLSDKLDKFSESLGQTYKIESEEHK